MKYRFSVLYFLNLFLKHFFLTENGNFCENIQIRRPLSFCVLTCRACPIDVLPDRCTVCSVKGRHIHPVRLAKHPKQILQTKHTFTKKLRGRPFDSAGEGWGGGAWQFMSSQNLLWATIFIFIKLQQRPFILRYSLFESDGCRIIYLFS